MSNARRWIVIALVAVLLLTVAGAASGVWARQVSQTAKLGKSQLIEGTKRLAAKDTSAAAESFQNAQASFSSVERSLGPKWVASTISAIPWVGRQYDAARALAQVGDDGSRAGLAISTMLAESPKGAKPSDTLAGGREQVDAALSAIADAVTQTAALSPDGLVPPLAKAVTDAKTAIAKLGPFATRIPALYTLEQYLTSGDRRILVISQDGAELRPTGGWAGSFGIIDVGPKGAKLEGYHDVFVLPNPLGKVQMPQGARQTSSFNFRNANWWLDYPTSARQMLAFWDAYKQEPVDGIVVLDTTTISELLKIVGPIEVPEFGRTFTADNLLSTLITMTQVERPGQPDRKDVLVAMSKLLEKRLLKASPEELAKVIQVLGTSADQKHIQMYFKDPAAQAAVETLGWSGAVSPPTGTTDMVAISNAMNKGGKANIIVSKTIDYAVGLQADGSAETTLTLGYQEDSAFPYPSVPDVFRDWLRVYRLPGTEFLPNPAGRPTTTAAPYTLLAGRPTTGTADATEFGFPAETRQFVLTRGSDHTETFVARVPDALNVGERYQLYFVRQSDLQAWPTRIVIKAPQGAQIAEASAHYVASGETLPVKVNGATATLSRQVKGDMVVSVTAK